LTAALEHDGFMDSQSAMLLNVCDIHHIMPITFTADMEIMSGSFAYLYFL
jgi:hypothetical protein